MCQTSRFDIWDASWNSRVKHRQYFFLCHAKQMHPFKLHLTRFWINNGIQLALRTKTITGGIYPYPCCYNLVLKLLNLDRILAIRIPLSSSCKKQISLQKLYIQGVPRKIYVLSQAFLRKTTTNTNNMYWLLKSENKTICALLNLKRCIVVHFFPISGLPKSLGSTVKIQEFTLAQKQSHWKLSYIIVREAQ